MSKPIERIRALLPLPECESLLECPKCGALAGPVLEHTYDRVVRAPDLALLVKLADAVKRLRDYTVAADRAEDFPDANRRWHRAQDDLASARRQVDAILAELDTPSNPTENLAHELGRV